MLPIPEELTSPPVVSVVVPAYRASRYIETAVDSALGQTFADHEIIVVNDGCPETIDLERSLQRYQERLVYLKQGNKGPGAARNAGIRAARGTFIAFLDADDYWAPNYLAEQMLFFETYPKTDMVYADAVLVGDSPLAGRTFMETAPSAGPADLDNLLTGRCTVILSGTVVRKQCLLDVGLFDECLRRAEDYDLWLRLARSNAAISYHRKVLLFRRELSTALCADKAGLFLDELRVLAKLATQEHLTAVQKEKLSQQVKRMQAAITLEHSKVALEQRDFRGAAAAVQEANNVYNSWKLRAVFLSLRLSPRLLLYIRNRFRPAAMHQHEEKTA